MPVIVVSGTINNHVNVDSGQRFVVTDECRPPKKGEYYLCGSCNALRHMKSRGWVHVYHADIDIEGAHFQILRKSKN